jgi:hypothetical protein
MFSRDIREEYLRILVDYALFVDSLKYCYSGNSHHKTVDIYGKKVLAFRRVKFSYACVHSKDLKANR